MQSQEKQIEPVSSKEPVHVVVLTAGMDVELKHHLLGQVLRRIRDFATKYDADGNPVVVAHEVEADFVSGANNYLMLLAVRDLKVVGHLLARVVTYFGYRYVYVQQMEIDHGSGVTLEQERAAFRMIQAWRKEVQARGVRAVAPSAAHVRRLRMLHGGEAILTTMKFGGNSNG